MACPGQSLGTLGWTLQESVAFVRKLLRPAPPSGKEWTPTANARSEALSKSLTSE